jgi:hypothetical protein
MWQWAMAPAKFAETLYNLNVLRGLFPKGNATHYIIRNINTLWAKAFLMLQLVVPLCFKGLNKDMVIMTDPNLLCLNVAHVISHLCLPHCTEQVRYVDVHPHSSCSFKLSGTQPLDGTTRTQNSQLYFLSAATQDSPQIRRFL